MKIMIVDDSRDDQILIEHYLKQAGIDQLVFYSSSLKAFEALELWDRQNSESKFPDLLLVDIMMPTMNGLEFCQIIKQKPRLAEIPVIVMTASDKISYLEQAFEVGARDFIKKPLKRIELLSRVKQAFNLYKERINRENAEQKLCDVLNDLQQDISIAKQIQKNMLGRAFSNQSLSIDARFIPSTELSGDLYYWVPIDKHKYGLIICDVRGHGIPGALISMSIRSLLYGLFTRVTEPVQVISELNRHMYRLYIADDPDRLISYYFTAIYLLIDTKEKKIEYSNAGHPPGLLFKPDSTHEVLNIGSPPIGLLSDIIINKGEIQYEVGSTIFLYSDGLTELPDNREIDGVQFLCNIVNKENLDDPQLLDLMIEHRLQASSTEDDICLISIKLQ
ncbi:PP2C family protein-serine/threonine phosphatase [Bacillus sp. FJAT-45350]|uniref:PP2C family protein-serine/threonine phosphatase n=1 Tax=Bacillus sp. FJAT-45350 TaxID=2011014 RepID=UPI000BB80C92|nr:fused response regulator/phosphatase [Bacillus sp. FJAT-45350]